MESLIKSRVFQYLLIVLLGFILYGNTVKHDYALDDKRLILENKSVQKGKFKELITHGTFYGFNADNSGAYRPLSMVYYSVFYKAGNGKPGIFHLLNILLFILTSVLFFEILKLIFTEKNVFLPLGGVLLFLVHPIHTEVVANIKSADEILCLLFSLTAILYWIRYLKTPINKNIIFSVLAYTLALLSKETAVAFLPVFAGLIFVFPTANFKAALKPLFLFALVIMGYLTLRSAILTESIVHSFLAINNSLYAIDDFSHLLATRIYILGFYAFKMIWSLPFSWDYSYGAITEHTFKNPDVWISLLLLASSVFVLIRYFKKEPVLILGIIWFWTLLLPASNTFIMIESTFAERFLYSPSPGFILILIWIFTKLNASGKKIFGGVFGIFLILFASQTVARNAQWKNDKTIVQADVQHSDAIRIQMSYVSDLYQKAEKITDPIAKKAALDSALLLSQKVYNMLPDYAEGNYLLARAYLYLQKNEEAEKYYLSTLKYEPKNVKALNDLGVIYGNKKDFEKSLGYFKLAVTADSSDVKSAENAGTVAFYLKRYDLSKTYFEKALRINPGSTVALQNLPQIDSMINFQSKQIKN
jgi:Tfp pilus assembly protein PilF